MKSIVVSVVGLLLTSSGLTIAADPSPLAGQPGTVAAPVLPDTRPKWFRDGPFVAAGFGIETAGIGASMGYSFVVAPSVHIVPFFGYGLVPQAPKVNGPSAGAMMVAGKEWNLVLSLSGGMVGATEQVYPLDPGIHRCRKQMWGGAFGIGGQWQMANGIFARALTGVTLGSGLKDDGGREAHIGLGESLSVGYRF